MVNNQIPVQAIIQQIDAIEAEIEQGALQQTAVEPYYSEKIEPIMKTYRLVELKDMADVLWKKYIVTYDGAKRTKRRQKTFEDAITALECFKEIRCENIAQSQEELRDKFEKFQTMPIQGREQELKFEYGRVLRIQNDYARLVAREKEAAKDLNKVQVAFRELKTSQENVKKAEELEKEMRDVKQRLTQAENLRLTAETESEQKELALEKANKTIQELEKKLEEAGNHSDDEGGRAGDPIVQEMERRLRETEKHRDNLMGQINILKAQLQNAIDTDEQAKATRLSIAVDIKDKTIANLREQLQAALNLVKKNADEAKKKEAQTNTAERDPTGTQTDNRQGDGNDGNDAENLFQQQMEEDQVDFDYNDLVDTNKKISSLQEDMRKLLMNNLLGRPNDGPSEKITLNIQSKNFSGTEEEKDFYGDFSEWYDDFEIRNATMSKRNKLLKLMSLMKGNAESHLMYSCTNEDKSDLDLLVASFKRRFKTSTAGPHWHRKYEQLTKPVGENIDDFVNKKFALYFKKSKEYLGTLTTCSDQTKKIELYAKLDLRLVERLDANHENLVNDTSKSFDDMICIIRETEKKLEKREELEKRTFNRLINERQAEFNKRKAAKEGGDQATTTGRGRGRGGFTAARGGRGGTQTGRGGGTTAAAPQSSTGEKKDSQKDKSKPKEGAETDSKTSGVVCWYCNKPGHTKVECRNKQKDDAEREKNGAVTTSTPAKTGGAERGRGGGRGGRGGRGGGKKLYSIRMPDGEIKYFDSSKVRVSNISPSIEPATESSDTQQSGSVSRVHTVDTVKAVDWDDILSGMVSDHPLRASATIGNVDINEENIHYERLDELTKMFQTMDIRIIPDEQVYPRDKPVIANKRFIDEKPEEMASWKNVYEFPVKFAQDYIKNPEPINIMIPHVQKVLANESTRVQDLLDHIEQKTPKGKVTFSMRIPVPLGNTCIDDVLLDTGSFINLITHRTLTVIAGRDSEFANAFKLQNCDVKVPARGVGGEMLRVTGAVLLQVTLGRTSKEVIFFVYQQDEHNIIMGLPALQELEFTFASPHFGNINLLGRHDKPAHLVRDELRQIALNNIESFKNRLLYDRVLHDPFTKKMKKVITPEGEELKVPEAINDHSSADDIVAFSAHDLVMREAAKNGQLENDYHKYPGLHGISPKVDKLNNWENLNQSPLMRNARDQDFRVDNGNSAKRK